MHHAVMTDIYYKQMGQALTRNGRGDFRGAAAVVYPSGVRMPTSPGHSERDAYPRTDRSTSLAAVSAPAQHKMFLYISISQEPEAS